MVAVMIARVALDIKSNYKNSKVTDLIVMVANKVHSASNSSDTNIRNNNGQIMGSRE